MKPTQHKTKKPLMLKMAGYIVLRWLSQLNLAIHGLEPTMCQGESLRICLEMLKVPSLDYPSYLCGYFYM